MNMNPQLFASNILAGAAKRIAVADQEANESDVMFVAGRFEEHFQAKADEVAERISKDADAILGEQDAG